MAMSEIGTIEVRRKLSELKFWNIYSVKNGFTNFH